MWPRSARHGREGLPLNVTPLEAAEMAPAADPRAMELAYERGLHEGRERERRRGRHPATALMIGLVAVAGAVILGTAAWYGSFGKGGAVVDQKLSVVADRAEPGLRAAAGEAGEAGEVLAGAGASLEAATQPSDSAAPIDEAQ